MDEEITIAQISAGILGSIVEKKSLDEGLRDVGLSEEILLEQWIAPYNQDVVRSFAKENITNVLGELKIEKNIPLYLVKKVLCDPAMFEDMAAAVEEQDTDKFRVLRVIGCVPAVIKYKGEQPGLESYLVCGNTPSDALRNAQDPLFYHYSSLFDAEDAKRLDSLITAAFYDHTIESVEASMQAIFGF